MTAAGTQRLFEHPSAIPPCDDVASGMLPVATYQRKRLIDAVDFTVRGQSEPQLVVVTHDQVFIERPQLFQQMSRHDHAWQGNDGYLFQEPFQDPARRGWPVC